jgi:hypothetical protein
MGHTSYRIVEKSPGGIKKKLKDGLQKVGTVLMRYAGFLTIGLGILAYLIHTAIVISVDPGAWGTQIWILLLPIAGAILYLVFVQKSLQTNIINKKTQLFLIISTGIACGALFWPGIPLFILFLEKSVVCETPFWNVLIES